MSKWPFILRYTLPLFIGAAAVHYLPAFTTGAIIFGMLTFLLVHHLGMFATPRSYRQHRQYVASHFPWDEHRILLIRKMLICFMGTCIGILLFQWDITAYFYSYLIAALFTMCSWRMLENFYALP